MKEIDAANEYMIRVRDVSKLYKLFDRKKDRLLDALGFSRKKRYTEHYALRHVSFDVHKGETVGIIGVNGSGKSTLLKIITGVLAPTEGEVAAGGRISALLELGAGFNMEYTGIENIYLNGTMMGYSREEVDEKLDAILKFADIGEFVHQPVKSYSSGMFVRLAFALAINIEPEILIVDEALSVGDAFFQAKCYHKFEEFRNEGKTILFVSHDLSSISKYCDRVIVLSAGEIVAEGKPKAMVDLYKRLLVKSPEADRKETAEQAGRHKEALEVIPWNPSVVEYGEKQAEITEISIYDEEGNLTNSIYKDEPYEICISVSFKAPVEAPICAVTIKDLKGIELCGTNTMYEGQDLPSMMPGDSVTVRFRQTMTLQGGEYLISVGCTGYSGGEFHVFHRLYDVVSLNVVSSKNTVGVFDMHSEIRTDIERPNG